MDIENQTVSIFATTDEGKRVILYSNGVWQYEQKSGLANVWFEAGLVLNNNEVRRIPRKTFYLLKKPLLSIISEIPFRGKKFEDLSELERSMNGVGSREDYLYMVFGKSAFTHSYEYELFFKDSIKKIKENMLKSFKTDFEGKSEIEPIETGNYYLTGVISLSQGKIIVWDFPVSIAPDTRRILFDQTDAVFNNED